MKILQLWGTQSDGLILYLLSKQLSQVFSMSNCGIQIGELPVITLFFCVLSSVKKCVSISGMLTLS
jgi:hypothetical protein